MEEIDLVRIRITELTQLKDRAYTSHPIDQHDPDYRLFIHRYGEIAEEFGRYYLDQGDLGLADLYLHMALKIYERMLAWNKMAEILRDLGQAYCEAQDMAEKAHECFEEARRCERMGESQDWVSSPDPL